MLQLQVTARATGVEAGDAFAAPRVHTLSQWVSAISCRADLLAGRAAAFSPSAQQVHALWSRVIEQQQPDLLRPACRALARQGRAADRLIAQWLEEPACDDGYPRQFLRWRQAVQRAMQDKHWFVPEDWLRHLRSQLQDGTAAALLPEGVVLSGFAEITRLERALFESLEQAGVPVEYERARKLSPERVRVRHFESFEHELAGMAQWAAEEAAGGKTRIAVIVNNLDEVADQVRRVFEDTFHPDTVLGLGDFGGGGFHFSSEASLGSQPLVRQALDLLRVSVNGPRKPLEFPSISRLLLGVNWAGAVEERAARAALEFHLREKRRYRLSLAGLAALASRGQLEASLPRLTRLCATLKAADPGRPPAQQLLDWLVHWGWPGQQPLDAAAGNALQQLLGAIEALSARPFSDAAECLASLTDMCNETTINQHGGAFSPVQVMSPAEAFGQRFDSAWAGNLGENNWPGRTVDNAYIPARIKADIPRASDAGVLAYTDRLMQDLAGCARTLTFSGANRFGDVAQAVSPLLSELNPDSCPLDICPEEQPARRDTPLSLVSAPRAEEISDYARHPWLRAHLVRSGLPLAAAEAQPLHGAVRRFNYQSACPLAGYLVFRLDARMEEPPGPFADAAFRGRLLHAALHYLYQPMLGSGEEPQVDGVEQAVAEALRAEYADARLMPASLEAEGIRLRHLLTTWLEQERVRPGGRPLQLEWQSRLSLFGFEFDVRIDRLDRIGNEAVFILDYKSGGVASPAWGSERLEDMQLPLYAVALADAGEWQPAGVALLQLKPGDIRAFGITGDPDAACDGVQVAGGGRGALARRFDDWEAVLAFWRREFAKLAEEIRAGDCSHRLYNRKALRYAGIEMLLRNAELEHWLADNGPGAKISAEAHG